MNTKDISAKTTHDAEDDPRNRDIKIYINGDLRHRDDATVSVYDSGFLLGDGMWEGMRLYNGKWAFFDDHMERFFNSCKAVSLEVGMDKAGILAALTRTAEANNMTHDAHVRLMLTKSLSLPPFADPQDPPVSPAQVRLLTQRHACPAPPI